jgi:cytochrome c-type biogenesis protein CcmH/NrfG
MNDKQYNDALEALSAREKQSFRRSALIFSIITILAVAILAYTAVRVRRAVREVQNAQVEAQHARTELETLRGEQRQLRMQLQRAREATQYVTEGINYYHQGRYGAAVNSYDQALKLDPENPYVLNLKGYSLFKQRDLKPAIAALRHSVSVEPEYAWGYFDLARAQCAAGEFQEARKSVSTAISLRPELKSVMRSDGEFTHLCKSIAGTYQP